MLTAKLRIRNRSLAGFVDDRIERWLNKHFAKVSVVNDVSSCDVCVHVLDRFGQH